MQRACLIGSLSTRWSETLAVTLPLTSLTSRVLVSAGRCTTWPPRAARWASREDDGGRGWTDRPVLQLLVCCSRNHVAQERRTAYNNAPTGAPGRWARASVVSTQPQACSIVRELLLAMLKKCMPFLKELIFTQIQYNRVNIRFLASMPNFLGEKKKKQYGTFIIQQI